MSNPYIGEIRLFGGNFAPQGWAFCNGSLVPISEFEALFNLIGTTYGGDGQTTFALPDLRGRVPVHQGTGPGGLSNRVIGEMGGVESVTLNSNQLPAHGHTLNATTTPATSAATVGGLTAASATTLFYGSAPGGGDMAPQALLATGGGQPHNNIAPSLGLSYIISLFGIFPSPA
jgi:microcystin-dependent protein